MRIIGEPVERWMEYMASLAVSCLYANGEREANFMKEVYA